MAEAVIDRANPLGVHLRDSVAVPPTEPALPFQLIMPGVRRLQQGMEIVIGNFCLGHSPSSVLVGTSSITASLRNGAIVFSYARMTSEWNFCQSARSSRGYR